LVFAIFATKSWLAVVGVGNAIGTAAHDWISHDTIWGVAAERPEVLSSWIICIARDDQLAKIQ